MHTFLKRKQNLRFSIAGKNAPFGETDNPVTLSTLKLLKEGFFKFFHGGNLLSKNLLNVARSSVSLRMLG